MRKDWPLILNYHGVIPEVKGVNQVELRVLYQHEFERQLRILKRNWNFLYPKEFAEYLQMEKPFPKNSVLITIDDGFQNTLDYALPVAEAVGVPLLVFVSSKHLDGGDWLWFSRFHAHRLLGGNGVKQFEERHQRMTLEHIEALLDDIGAPRKNSGRALHNLLFNGMCSHDLRKASEGGFLTVGGHGFNHPRLPNETDPICEQEIIFNKKQLERIVEKQILFFAYPQGLTNVKIAYKVKEAGYIGAFMATPFPESIPEDLGNFYIPRVGVYRKGRIYFQLKCWGFEHWRHKLGALV